MQKPKIRFYTAIGLLILGSVWFSLSRLTQATLHTFQATVKRDCAPWDGSAFSITIPLETGTSIDISIWKAPDIKLPVTFSFPDQTGQVGNASYRSSSNSYQQLSGIVFFWRVEEGHTVTGKFKLVTETGQPIEGQFEAEWKNQMMLCG